MTSFQHTYSYSIKKYNNNVLASLGLIGSRVRLQIKARKTLVYTTFPGFAKTTPVTKSVIVLVSVLLGESRRREMKRERMPKESSLNRSPVSSSDREMLLWFPDSVEFNEFLSSEHSSTQTWKICVGDNPSKKNSSNDRRYFFEYAPEFTGTS